MKKKTVIIWDEDVEECNRELPFLLQPLASIRIDGFYFVIERMHDSLMGQEFIRFIYLERPTKSSDDANTE